MIIDCFPYNGENNILEIRLNSLNDIVDKFIILESPKSHSKIPRELEFQKIAHKFEKFKEKIKYYAIDYCHHDNFHYNDFSARDILLKLCIENAVRADDIIIHGDLDEIPDSNILKNVITKLQKPATIMLDYRVLCFDLQYNNPNGKFPGPVIIKYKDINKPLSQIRQERSNSSIYDLINGGWHFTYCAGIDKTIDKFKYFIHANEMGGCVKDRDGLINCIKNKISFAGAEKLEKIDIIKGNFPDYILDNFDNLREYFSQHYNEN